MNERWIYTYDYAPGSIWEPWRDEVYANGGLDEDGVPLWLEPEAQAVAERVAKAANGRLLCSYLLLADSHFTYNGTWEDTVESMRAVASALDEKSIRLHRIIHLGDLTDGLLPKEKTDEIEQACIRDMERILTADALHLVPGNHDYNYFRGNPDIKYPTTPQYYIDEPKQRLRLIFLDSFDPKEQFRYGFSEYCIHWLDAVFHLMPKDYAAIIFSHVPPLVRLQAWTDNIRNRQKLMPVLDHYADRILAFINGHNHCDHLFNDLHNGKFPIISINCAKCEYFTEHKPKGAVVPFRRLGEWTQESFDIMQVDVDRREIYFTRFGAGSDRLVRNGMAQWV